MRLSTALGTSALILSLTATAAMAQEAAGPAAREALERTYTPADEVWRDGSVWMQDRPAPAPEGMVPVPYYRGIGYRYPYSYPVRGYWPYGYGYEYYPWAPLPQTLPELPSPPSITHTPRLGLQYNYPFGYHPGIRPPEDTAPLLAPPNLGPYVGVVGAAKAQLAAQADAALRKADADPAIALLREGKNLEAGRLLTARYRSSDDPRAPLLLSELLFVLGKPKHAEALLRQALGTDEALSALPEDVASHFPSRDDFEAKLQDLVSSGEHQLLAAYLLVHSRKPEQGVDRLGELSSQGNEVAARLYRHYLSRAFSEPKQ